MLARLLTAKVAAFSAVALFSVGTAAAATGNLPDPVQRGVASTLSHVGVDLVAPTDESTTSTTSTTLETGTTTSTTADTTTTTSDSTATPSTESESVSDRGVGPDANGPAKHGLCIAFFAGNGHEKNPEAVAFRNLADAATAAGMTAEAFCTPTSTTTTVAILDDSATTADDTTESDDATTGHGKSGSTPGATAPGRKSTHGKL